MFILNVKKNGALPLPSAEVWTDLQEPDIRDQPSGILSVLCEWLEQQQTHEFVIVTSEKAYRPLISRDFLIFLEQLPNVNAAIKNKNVSEFFIDFFEQGFELKFNCRKKDGLVLIHCIEDYWNTAKEVGATQQYCLVEFSTVLHKVAREFAHIVLAAYPKLQQMNAFTDWCRQSGCHLK